MSHGGIKGIGKISDQHLAEGRTDRISYEFPLSSVGRRNTAIPYQAAPMRCQALNLG